MYRVSRLIFSLVIFLSGCGLFSQKSIQNAVQAKDQPDIFHLLQTIQVTPDDYYDGGSFVRINHVPSTDRFVVTFRAEFSQPFSGCKGIGHAYKEYTLDMEETGNTGVFSCEVADLGSLLLDKTYYDVSMHAREASPGWMIRSYNVENWQLLKEVFLPLDFPRERDNDPTVAFINGQLDISAQYDANGLPARLQDGAATHHHFFSSDLKPLGGKVLSDTPHVCGASMMVVDGITYFVTADAFMGDVILMKYDRDWNYLGMKKLIKEAHWSTGLVFNGERFYLAYLDSSHRTMPGYLPVYLNVHLAAFDRDWNLIEDIAVTDYSRKENMQPGRTWLLLHDNKLYISYDLDTYDPASNKERLKWQAIVKVYELEPMLLEKK